MAVLAADRNIPKKGAGLGNVMSYLVKSSTTIFKGSQVSLDANGQALPSADTAATHSVGIALEQVIQGATVTKRIRVASDAYFLLVTGTIASTDLGKSVYVSDSANAVLATGTGQCFIGKLADFVTTTSAWVFIPGGPQQAGATIA